MSALNGLLLTPLAGALLLLLLPPLKPWSRRLVGWLSLASSALTLLAALWLATGVVRGHDLVTTGHARTIALGLPWQVDALNLPLILLTAFIGFTTAIFARPYMVHACVEGRIGPIRLRTYHILYQLFMLTMLVALTTDNLGVLWVAVEGATLATVLLVSLYRTPEAIEAAWKYFILCSVGIALALFGTVLTYFAAQQVLAEPEAGLTWSLLQAAAGDLNPAVMRLAFVFLLVGYGTKVGLVPMHQWLPDAHSEGPTPMSAVLSGLLLNIALYALVRLKIVVDGSLAATTSPHLAGYLMMGFGLLSFLIAALFLHRQRDIKRLFSYSSIEHMGLMTFAFGLGGALATFGALLHMLVHSLTKSAIFISVGHATHLAGSQRIDQIRGLIRTQPAVGWGLLLGVIAIAGFPPFGIFTSEFLLLSATMQTAPWLSILLLFGLAIAFAGLFRHLQPMVYGKPPAGPGPVAANMLPVAVHLGLVVWLGVAMPGLLVGWLEGAVLLVTGSAMNG